MMSTPAPCASPTRIWRKSRSPIVVFCRVCPGLAGKKTQPNAGDWPSISSISLVGHASARGASADLTLLPAGRSIGDVRQWVTPRALLLHAAFLLIAAGCLTAGWWQLHRAMQGNTLSYLYSVEWPAFVVVAGIGWWQMVRDTPEDIEGRRRFREQMRAASAEVVARTLPRSALAITADSRESSNRALVAGGPGVPNRTPAELASGDRADRNGASAGGASLVRGEASLAELGEQASLLAPDDDAPTDELSEYNRYLALLAVKGKPKTWRNPRGL